MAEKGYEGLKALSSYMRAHMTREEKHLWYDFLKKLPYTVHRQKQFGRYIVDFFCAEARLVIEIDGNQHYTEEGLERDHIRDEYLKDCGFRVLRITNHSIHTNFRGVCDTVLNEIVEGIEKRRAKRAEKNI